jgi:MOSC domain-containing protein YiiM
VNQPEVISVNISQRTGERKKPVSEGWLEPDRGLANDAHSGTGRQVSLLAMESIAKIRGRGVDVNPGDFAENLTTRGIDLVALPIGTVMAVGQEILLRVTQIGKECHDRCSIFYQAGDCVMPREGIFAEVVKGGRIVPGDAIRIMT